MDLLQRYNKYPVPAGESEILGVEGNNLKLSSLLHENQCYCIACEQVKIQTRRKSLSISSTI